ncbi:hypothetical protein, partial [Rhodospirillum rubrum]|uniref:hypothetical protein n=1 Tax=Rhodospirillum rubrum TaxID=1085 RepID=UPI0028AB53B7
HALDQRRLLRQQGVFLGVTQEIAQQQFHPYVDSCLEPPRNQFCQLREQLLRGSFDFFLNRKAAPEALPSTSCERKNGFAEVVRILWAGTAINLDLIFS